MMLDNAYIAEKIRLRTSEDDYGVDEFCGRRFLYKTCTDQMIVFAIPRIPAGEPYEPTAPDGSNPSEDLASYPTRRATVEALNVRRPAFTKTPSFPWRKPLQRPHCRSAREECSHAPGPAAPRHSFEHRHSSRPPAEPNQRPHR